MERSPMERPEMERSPMERPLSEQGRARRPHRTSRAWGVAFALPVLAVLYLWVAAWKSGTPPAALGVHEGKLLPCPAKPNCVSDGAGDPAHHVDPLRTKVPGAEGWAALKDLVRRQPGTTVVAEAGPYLHAEVRSALFGFVDDLELLAGEPAVSVRSASRVGTLDFGANRRRVEALRELAAGQSAARP